MNDLSFIKTNTMKVYTKEQVVKMLKDADAILGGGLSISDLLHDNQGQSINELLKNDIKKIDCSHLKFYKEESLRQEMLKVENLIIHLESKEFNIKYGVPRYWWHKQIDSFIEECNKSLLRLAKDLLELKQRQ